MVQYVSGTNCGHHGQNGQRHAQRQLWYKKPLILFTRETPYHSFIFPAGRARAARAPPRYLRQINSAILKVPDAAWNCYARIPGCRRTVPMEPPMSNSSMPHREPIKWNPWYAYNPAGGFLYYSSICRGNSQDSKSFVYQNVLRKIDLPNLTSASLVTGKKAVYRALFEFWIRSGNEKHPELRN